MRRIHIRPDWYLPDAAATPESVYLRRREFLAMTAGALLLPSVGCAQDVQPKTEKYKTAVKRNAKYGVDRALTKESDAIAFNNYYEFTLDKRKVWKLAQKLTVDPWSVEIGGHCKRQGKFDLDDLLKKLPQEERVYRFRCVEAWAMTVPWIGIPMRKFIDWAEPTSKAKYLRFQTVWRPKEMPGRDFRNRFPYYEGLRMDEARNELSLLVTGLYGRPVPKQNGAPIRVIVPWKYGFKSAKSLVRIDFVENRPKTFWNDLYPREYGFFANVYPERAHPRWTQATEWRIPDRERHKTLPYNGYGEFVADMYKDDPKKYGY